MQSEFSTDNLELLENDQVRPSAATSEEVPGTGQVHEKLHEDDKRKQPRWKTVLYKVLPFLENGKECAHRIRGLVLEQFDWK